MFKGNQQELQANESRTGSGKADIQQWGYCSRNAQTQQQAVQARQKRNFHTQCCHCWLPCAVCLGGSHERVSMGCVLCWTGRVFLLGLPRYEDTFPLQLPRNFQRLYLGQSLAQGFRSHPWRLLVYWEQIPRRCRHHGHQRMCWCRGVLQIPRCDCEEVYRFQKDVGSTSRKKCDGTEVCRFQEDVGSMSTRRCLNDGTEEGVQIPRIGSMSTKFLLFWDDPSADG